YMGTVLWNAFIGSASARIASKLYFLPKAVLFALSNKSRKTVCWASTGDAVFAIIPFTSITLFIISPIIAIVDDMLFDIAREKERFVLSAASNLEPSASSWPGCSSSGDRISTKVG